MTNKELKKCICCPDFSICGGSCASAYVINALDKQIKENIHKHGYLLGGLTNGKGITV